MKKHEAEKLIETIRGFVEDVADRTSGETQRIAGPVPGLPKGSVANRQGENPAQPPNGHHKLTADEQEKLYQVFKRRIIEDAAVDPILLHLISVQPEIVVDVERRTMSLEGSTLKGRLAKMIASGWLKTPRKQVEVRKELIRTGSDPGGNLSAALSGLKLDGFLVCEGEEFSAAPGVKVTERSIEK